MKGRMILAALAGLAIGATVWFSGVLAPGPTASTGDDCTTCDARQLAKQRLREHLKAIDTQDY